MGSVHLQVASSTQFNRLELSLGKNMKFFALLMVVGLAAASGLSGERGLRFETGKEFTFEYSGRLMTGFPALNSQYSGMGINATVSLIARTPTTLGMIVSQPKFVKINDVLEPTEDNVPSTYDGTNWRRVKLPQMMEVPEEFKRILSLPVVVELDGQTGEVAKVTISKREPEWSVNLKKGIVSLFQVKMESGVNTNMIQTTGEQTYWKVMEETVSGKCLSSYQVNELPEYIVRENPTLVPVPEACPTNKYFEVVHSVDFNNCQKQSSFSFYRPGHFMQKGSSESINNIGNMLSRSSTTRFIACGSSSGQMTIQTIVNDGEFDVQLMGTKTERLVSGSLQTLKLKSVRPAGQMPQPSEPVTLETMMYEYTEKAYGRPSVSSNSISEQILSEGRIPRSELTDGKVLAKAIPRTFFHGLNSETTPNKSEFVSEITKILKEVLLIIRGEKNIEVNHEVNQMLLTAVRGMTALESVEEIERLYTTVLSGLSGEQTLTMKQLFLDTVVMTGTPHSLEFFERLVRQGKVPQSEITAFFMFLPRYVVLPTEQVLNRLFKLVTEVSEGELTGLTLTTSLILKSTRPRTFTYTLTAAHGFRNSGSSKIHHEWNLMLESQIPQTQLKNVSVSGKLTMPILPIWNIEHIRNSLIHFEYENKMALTLANGKTSEIITTGTAKTSEEQKSFSSMSSEAKQLRNLIATRTTGASSKLIAELEEIVRIQASTLDKVVFQTEYVNVPRSFEVAQSKVINLLKAYLYPYYCPSASTVESHQFESLRYKSTVQVSFHQQTPSFDLEIVRPTEKVFFRNVRVSYPYNLFFPLSAIRNNVRLAANQLVSGSVLSTKTCAINGNHMIKFNGQSVDISDAMTKRGLI